MRDLVGFQLGMNEFNLDNTNYPTGNNGAAFQAGGWTATTEGALWIKTGSGSPVLNTQDLNFELDYRATPTSAWITITNTYLLSNGVAEYDCSYDYYSYPGQFEGVDNTFGVPADHASPYRYLYAGSADTSCRAPGRRDSTPTASRPSRACSSTSTPGPARSTATPPPLPAAPTLP